MTPDEQHALLVVECDRMASVSADAAATPVPTMPEWTVEKLVRHVTFVHRMALAVLSVPSSGGMAKAIAVVEKPGRGPQFMDDYRAAAAEVLAAYENVDPSKPVATWEGEGKPDYWIRRQLHEVTVHRFDVQNAVHVAGGAQPDGIDAAGAADGVGEWAENFLTRFSVEQVPALAGRTVHLHTDDGTEAEFFLDFTSDRVVVSREHRKGDVAIRGSAEDLLLAVWRRRPLDVLDVVGEESVAQALYDGVRI
ncbi:maleylpyruvate isomerase N-terminal domain-containing protein [Rhodococcus sp. G-MC3]|uniref:maleylpyruvate isomerase N-terminal domain-containing protein n=1 Tax=Rhodococcus sp. G-MC3 TaxID=3046209 RepID=UPI0024BA5C26|nr:maleylpyruvate isomerase N-terminal domain-containing protein [Rhodococcus sp. G-MC3]MDJ0394476.1 maleylpyruvate isomerase N-terminal domain-containing protein [Rhodococcus sp. G-MC3]